MGDVDGLWNEEVPIEEWGDSDFESRTSTQTVFDPDGNVRHCAQSLSELWNLGISATLDRAIRMYLAKLIDEKTLDVDREYYEIGILVPRIGWVKENIDPPLVTVEGGETFDHDVASATVPPTIDNLITKTVGQEIVDTKTQLIVESVEWLTEAKIHES